MDTGIYTNGPNMNHTGEILLLTFIYFIIGWLIATIVIYFAKKCTVRHIIVLTMFWPLFMVYLIIAAIMLTIFEVIAEIVDQKTKK
jgi:presenilin-like A22 family membrane protease